MGALKKEPLRIAFFDIDGVLTPSAEFIPGNSPKITPKSFEILRKFAKKGFKLVFITARSPTDLRLKGGFEDQLKGKGLLNQSLIYASHGLDQATYSYEFKMENNKPVFKNGSIILVKKPVVKRETYGELDKFLLFKMLLGREIKQEFKYAGFKIKPADSAELVSDARIFFQLQNNSDKERKRLFDEAKKIVEKMRKTFLLTRKFGTPVDLQVRDIVAGISIDPAGMGKHFGVLRAIKLLGVMPKDKIIAYAFGDRDLDAEMKIRKDINFFKVKNNADFARTAEKILKKF